MTNDEIVAALKAAHPDSVVQVTDFRGDLAVTVRKSDIVKVATSVRDIPSLAFDLVIDVLGVDFNRPGDRFEVVYILYSTTHKRHLRLKVAVEEEHPAVPSVTSVWPGANWHERETFDMFGIRFEGHPDMRRLYMPEEFEYYPLRKDFPLLGIPDSLPLPRR
ncbi:MAG TPA: NADH-quinone oxidoreductase subunit C [Bacteroidota bacterium]|nr:NADH-quinone oxidoreductase subunit C [Bacteroidota bacterium]